jgi:hypothetical protein
VCEYAEKRVENLTGCGVWGAVTVTEERDPKKVLF